MKHFKEYSKYYDLLYRDKDYNAEVAYIDEIIRKYKQGNASLLDIGCGTGKHASIFADKGYEVHGVDISETMINIAKENYGQKAMFSNQDMRFLDLNKKFDVITSLFHVMSYQTDNDSVRSCFKSVNSHLNNDGIFIFDCWYGPGVVNDLPSVRVKRMSDEQYDIVRIAEPVIHWNESVIDVNFDILIKEKRSSVLTQIQEKHPMRYFFKNEVALFAQEFGFKIVDFFAWLSFNEPTSKDWYVVFVLKK